VGPQDGHRECLPVEAKVESEPGRHPLEDIMRLTFALIVLSILAGIGIRPAPTATAPVSHADAEPPLFI
jgi:hypothetical protein